MTWIDELPTPAVLVEKTRLEANIAGMQARADAQGVALRPHTKTHKSVRIAKLQREAGARGLTVAKLGEAEVLVDAGFSDVRLAYPLVSTDKLDRAQRLMERARISFCVDTIEAARLASSHFEHTSAQAQVMVEVDIGYGRCGVRWDVRDSIDFVTRLTEMPGLRVCGILTHAGHSYNGPAEGQSEEAALRAVSNQERDRMLAFAAALQEAGVPGVEPGAFEISVGSTPSVRYFESAEDRGFRVTEIRPGNYVFHDAIQVALGVAGWDECALTVHASVISRHRNDDGSDRVFLDAGKKVFTSDLVPSLGVHGTLLYNPRVMEPLPHARLHGLSEEHGWVSVSGGTTLNVGDRVRVVPAHSCVVTNMLDEFHIVDGERVLESWRVDSRGRVS
ncbi:MAG: D-serine deaminase-like pyridoxal phosphate-dependent protein [Rhodothermales bacterium]|jgi:D-serine deaminase-like pyridoxal phosphate-dependent protein